MIVISKKRIQIIMSCVLIAVFAFTFQIANQQDKANGMMQQNEQQNTIATTATPVSGKTIVIDAGHGVPDEGAQSSNRELVEVQLF